MVGWLDRRQNTSTGHCHKEPKQKLSADFVGLFMLDRIDNVCWRAAGVTACYRKPLDDIRSKDKHHICRK